ncbi:MAG: hypothetical protein WCE44_16320 [Candidatus Velthaea sp.]|jgi:hypothetical protein
MFLARFLLVVVLGAAQGAPAVLPPPPSPSPSPLTTIGRTRTLTAECGVMVDAASKALARIGQNDAASADLDKVLKNTDFNASNPIAQQRIRNNLYKIGRTLQSNAAAANAEVQRLRDLSDTADIPRAHALKQLIAAFDVVNGAQRQMGADLVRALVVQEGRIATRDSTAQVTSNGQQALAGDPSPTPKGGTDNADGTFTGLKSIVPKSSRDRSDPDMNVLFDDLNDDFGDRIGQITRVEKTAVPPRIAVALTGC